jgi:hypothetical protein
MELVIQQNPIISWRFEAHKKLEAPKNIGEFIVRIPPSIYRFIDDVNFEVTFQLFWLLRRIIFNLS